MRRFVLSATPDREGRVELTGKDYRYLARVLRLGGGDRFRALLPSGEEALLTIEEFRLGSLIARKGAVGETADASALPRGGAAEGAVSDRTRRALLPQVPPIILCQALPKGHKMDLVVRQAAETGVREIVPFVSRHTVVRLEGEADDERKRDRWERIIREARQQSGSDIPTSVAKPTDLEGVVARWQRLREESPGSAAILLHQDPLVQGTLHGYLSHGPTAVLLAVGPEGGFSDQEASRLLAVGFRPLLLGANVLRAETAALFAAAATHVLLLESASWMPSNG